MEKEQIFKMIQDYTSNPPLILAGTGLTIPVDQVLVKITQCGCLTKPFISHNETDMTRDKALNT